MVPALLLPLLLAAQPKAEEPTLPAAWYGTWTGTLTITRDKDDPEQIPMALEVRPLDGGRYTFRITYGEGPKKQVRDYELVPKAGKPGRFEIDERNGIRIDARLTGGALDTLFQVGDSLIRSRYERTRDGLRVEITAFAVRDPLVTKPEKGGSEVRSFRVVSVQTAATPAPPVPGRAALPTGRPADWSGTSAGRGPPAVPVAWSRSSP